MFKTDENLQSAFAGECQAYCRYVIFAAKADKEGLPQTAKLFRAAAEAEMVHVRNHFNALDAVGSTRENLLAAATAEHREITSMYPAFVEKAAEDRNERARITFNLALKAEKVHNDIFEAAFQANKAGKPEEKRNYFVCQVCGNIEFEKPSAACKICGRGPENFKAAE